MQPRQRSKCCATVSLSSSVPSRVRLHQPDPAAGGVHLLVPELVGRAGRQAEAAVDAVVDELASIRRASPRGRTRRGRARRAATRPGRAGPATNAMPAAGAGEPRLASRASRTAAPPAAAWRGGLSAQTGVGRSPPGRAARPQLSLDRRLARPRTAARARPGGRKSTALGSSCERELAAGASALRGSSGLGDHRRLGAGADAGAARPGRSGRAGRGSPRRALPRS